MTMKIYGYKGTKIRTIICPICKKFEVQIYEGACDIETVKCEKWGYKIVVKR